MDAFPGRGERRKGEELREEDNLILRFKGICISFSTFLPVVTLQNQKRGGEEREKTAPATKLNEAQGHPLVRAELLPRLLLN